MAEPLQTIARALDVLLSYSEERTEWGASELGETLGWSQSSAQRVLAALASRGFLWADPSTRRYSLGPALWRSSLLFERTGGLGRIAGRSLERLAAETGLSASFSVRDGGFTRAVGEAVGPGGPQRTVPLVGELIPAHAGATSRVCFAFVDPEVRRPLVYGRPRGRYTERTELDADRLEALFERARTDGFAVSCGEWDATTRTLAVPLLLGRQVVGALSLTAAAGHPEPDLVGFLPLVRRAADELTAVLAGRTPAPRRDWRRSPGSV